MLSRNYVEFYDVAKVEAVFSRHFLHKLSVSEVMPEEFRQHNASS